MFAPIVITAEIKQKHKIDKAMLQDCKNPTKIMSPSIIVLAIIIAREIINAGKATWIEGFMLLATYLILAIGFYHLPDAVVERDRSAAEGSSVPTVQPGAQNLQGG